MEPDMEPMKTIDPGFSCSIMILAASLAQKKVPSTLMDQSCLYRSVGYLWNSRPTFVNHME